MPVLGLRWPAPQGLSRQDVIGGDAVQLRQGRQHGDIRQPRAVFPLAHGLVGDTQLIRRLLLGHAPGFPQRRQIGACLSGIHGPPSSLASAYRKSGCLTTPRP